MKNGSNMRKKPQIKPAKIQQLIKEDWMERTDFNKRDKSWMTKYYPIPKNNEEGD